MQVDSTKRFSNRVEYYLKYRPRYPEAIIGFMIKQLGLKSNSVVADIGSGTGFLSELFLKNGNMVFGVEPNKEMRKAGELVLANYPQFKSINATAEVTTLPPQSVDFVVAGQAFHWFDINQVTVEFNRILTPNGFVCLIWNSRLVDGTPFLEAYEALLHQYALGYKQVQHKNIGETEFRPFFGFNGFKIENYKNFQDFDFEGLKGRLLSSSYSPLPDHPNYEPMITKLQQIFNQFANKGQIRFEYETELVWGHLN